MIPAPTRPQARGSARLIRLMLLAFALLPLTDCRMLGIWSADGPAGFVQHYPAQQLTDPAQLLRLYRDLFPEQEKLHVNQARLVTDRRWLPDRNAFAGRIYYVATDRDHVRLRMLVATNLLLDLTLSDRTLAVALPGDAERRWVGFAGVIDEAGSPIQSVLGVEPGDLLPVFYLGQEVWKHEWRARERWRRVDLVPVAANASGLERIELDRATGLPRFAVWRRGEHRWTVTYESWDWFTDPNEGGEAMLMPREFHVAPDEPAVRLHVRMDEESNYLFGGGVPARMFEPPASLARSEIYGLEHLEDALREMLD